MLLPLPKRKTVRGDEEPRKPTAEAPQGPDAKRAARQGDEGTGGAKRGESSTRTVQLGGLPSHLV
eukprot:8588431-Pyramimonas_sp.AAC.1